MKPRHRKLALIAGGLAVLGLATALVLNAFQSNLVFFFTPTQVANREAPVDRTFRIGGMVEEGSLRRDADGLTVHFVITDRLNRLPVSYKGILPDLFKEGKGAVVQGRLRTDGLFVADQVLAKHDENYMPPEAAHSLEEARKAAAQAGKTLSQ